MHEFVEDSRYDGGAQERQFVLAVPEHVEQVVSHVEQAGTISVVSQN